MRILSSAIFHFTDRSKLLSSISCKKFISQSAPITVSILKFPSIIETASSAFSIDFFAFFVKSSISCSPVLVMLLLFKNSQGDSPVVCVNSAILPFVILFVFVDSLSASEAAGFSKPLGIFGIKLPFGFILLTPHFIISRGTELSNPLTNFFVALQI